MSSKTTNFNLHKIDLTDAPPDITVLNPNWDTIDSELAKGASFLITVTGNNSNGYTSDKTFAQINTAYQSGQDLRLYYNYTELRLVGVVTGLAYQFNTVASSQEIIVTISSDNVVSVETRNLYYPGNKPIAEDIGALPLAGGTMTGEIEMSGDDYPSILFTPTDGQGDSVVEGGDRIMSLHARDNKGVSNSRRQFAVYAPSARDIAEAVRIINTDASGNKTYYLIYGEHNKPTPSAIGAAPAYSYGTTDLTAGSSTLLTGKIHLVYE